ncbi:hypothetical protein QAD02_017874 [Eretmocerus hayati]|uniref:Uncharacterized protein n=1 Tax=Eretmocerus hayati TaxID=131215 RepID=A0ACC2PF39_9HYME|nr:hypothetical protein QAD02_017874 [Eretmocerus hayati]
MKIKTADSAAFASSEILSRHHDDRGSVKDITTSNYMEMTMANSSRRTRTRRKRYELLRVMHQASSLILVAGLLSNNRGVYGFSLSRTLNDVKQDVSEDASLYSQEMHIDEPELNLPTSSQKSQLERYVTIKSSPSSYVSVQRGQRLELKCEVDGSPPPRIYWVMGENPGKKVEELERESVAEVSYTAIAREISKLIIECPTFEDQGLIHCVGVSADKVAISEPTVLKVEGGKNGTSHHQQHQACREGASTNGPVITRHRPIYFSEMGTTVELPCEASGRPRAHVRWLDGDGNELVDPRFQVQPSGSLIIANIRWQDMDGYRCVATSEIGGQRATAEAVTFLYPAAKSESEKRKANAL